MNPQTGGPAQAIINYLPHWQAYGLDSYVVTLDDVAAPFVQNERIIALGNANNPWSYNKALYAWLCKHLIEYDIVLVHGLWLYHGYAVLKAFKQLKKTNKKAPKLYVMPHGMLDPYFQKAPERKWKALRNTIYWHLIEKKLIQQADALLFTCEEEMVLAKDTFSSYHPKATFNVGFGIEMPPAYTAEQANAFKEIASIQENESYILFLSRIHPKKGVDMLLKAYNQVFADIDNKNVSIPKLVIAGPGIETTYGEMLLQIVQQSKFLQKQVIFTGMLVGNAKWGALYGCEAFVLPSHQENFGIAVAEALACSKPVLISDKINIWREIELCHAGLINKDTISGVVELLQQWKGLSNNQKEDICMRAREVYEKNFLMQNAAHNLLQAIC